MLHTFRSSRRGRLGNPGANRAFQKIAVAMLEISRRHSAAESLEKRNSLHGTKRLPFVIASIPFYFCAVPKGDLCVLPLRCSDWRLVFSLEDRAYGEAHVAEAGSCSNDYILQLWR